MAWHVKRKTCFEEEDVGTYRVSNLVKPIFFFLKMAFMYYEQQPEISGFLPESITDYFHKLIGLNGTKMVI